MKKKPVTAELLSVKQTVMDRLAEAIDEHYQLSEAKPTFNAVFLNQKDYRDLTEHYQLMMGVLSTTPDTIVFQNMELQVIQLMEGDCISFIADHDHQEYSAAPVERGIPEHQRQIYF